MSEKKQIDPSRIIVGVLYFLIKKTTSDDAHVPLRPIRNTILFEDGT